MAFPGREAKPPVESYHVDHLTTRLSEQNTRLAGLTTQLAEQDVRLDMLRSRVDSLEAHLMLLESWVRKHVGVDQTPEPSEP